MAAAVDKAYLEIREGIVGGRYAPGAHLTAQGLATATGLSRTPVREAMRRLHAEGLIKIIPHRGAFVRHLDQEEISKIYDLAIILETYAAEAAARNATPAQLSELEGLCDSMEEQLAVLSKKKPTPQSIMKIADDNNRFHRLIVTAANNSWLQSAFSVIMEVPQIITTFRGYRVDEMKRSQTQHVELILAFRERDADWARSTMRSHVLAARHILLRNDAAAEAAQRNSAGHIAV
jgi:DNA-binding GntR family transcriptional regulator